MSASGDLGGKGANLVILREAGLPVPPFVVLPTGEYDTFVSESGLEARIASALRRGAAAASDEIRAAFTGATMGAEQRVRVLDAVAHVADGPVAVRSSATAEDLPGMSFAGQQDSFLNVVGAPAILEAVVACWASLWTERAIAYRDRLGFDQAEVSLAVVVQTMVDADAAGVLFTANPRTGRRDETVVDAAFGLGDALVSGAVIPDNYVLDPETGALRERVLAGSRAALNATQLEALVALGRRIVELYDVPMDIEFATQGDELFVVQARPITGLYPLPPANPRPHPTPEVWFSVGAFQGVLEPLTPLGQDALRMMLSAAPRVIGRRADWRSNRAVQVAGERLWLRVDPLLRTRATRTLLGRFLPFVEPGSLGILNALGEEPGLRPTHAAPPAAIMAALAAFGSRVASRARMNIRNPEAGRRHVDRAAARLVAGVQAELARAAGAATPQERLTGRAHALVSMTDQALPALLPVFGPIMVPSILQLTTLRELAAKTGLPNADALALNVMRALPGNVTTEMDLRLSDVAATIKSDANAWGWVAETSADDLARQFLADGLPRVAQRALGDFMADYGMRGVAEIDLGAPRWRDDPAPVMHTVKSYLTLPADAQPRAVHLAGQHEAGRSIRALMDASTPGRADKIRRAAKAIRGLAGARETPKFTMIRAFGLIRDGLDASAAELVEQGRLGAASDLVFLRFDEITRAFSADWHEVVAQRREAYETERRRTQVPRVLVEDGRALYDGLSAGEGDLHGAGVSPGVAEGPVRVVRDPRTTQLVPGEILVCPGTDPAWTPLFLTAGGLITEVGGLMTHGSVVAREYGIPAVVGVHDATTRLTDGQRIRLDGTSGVIEFV
ncbi:phosphoenolpyruvate synthase [Propioniciclava coleopterorum]|uniref:Phosphoenolpyruvate synthase n=1 Tax=Propioniciclava coleopterorum TaxID=2714937 RepID=A0A6G7Y611_9ACTN|nr:PEP/pyruvate-binding domain-containing protein [Propioniciclava coleopterorum]QIK72116.1 phosphoenolpyruvate synthase [Propioniciclava coleopterorum]